MRKIEPEFITGMGYIGASPGVLYRMGGAGEQTVVTGNPALLEGVKGNRFTSLTLHGKSTQESTTGAQLFDVSEILAETVLGIENPVVGHAVGYWTSGYIPVKTGNYIFSRKGTARGWTYDADKNGLRYINNVGDVPISIKEGEAFVRVSGKDAVDPQNFMFNEGDSIKPYEPYTGGKPSPSPEYPQEIENAGQSGEIGVDVYGGNLIKAPFESRENSYKPGYTFTQNGITFTVQDDMGIKVAGTNTYADKYAQFTAYYLSDDEKPKYPAGTYTFSEGATVQIKFASEAINKNGTFTANEEFNVNGFYIAIPAGQSVNKTVYPILNIGSTALPYEPYKPTQKLIVPTSGGLPGIPVSSGGNYTDEKGQQWVADEIDLAKGERVQRIDKTVVDGEKMKFVAGSNSAYWNLPFGTSPGIIANSTCTSRYFAKQIFKSNKAYDFIYTTQEIMKPYFDTPEELNAFCVKKNSEGNPLTIYYRIETPIRTPLSPETIAAYKALKTYSPTTTMINDAGAGMSAGYRRK